VTGRRGRDDTYWVLEPAQLRCLVSARRHDIVDQLAARGPMSVREIATAIHARPSALYYHLRELVRVGLVLEAGHRVVRRKREVVYASPAPRMRFRRAFDDPRNDATFVRIATAMTRQMQRDFRNGIAAPDALAAGTARNLGLFRLVGSPDRKALAAINRHLDAIAELFWKSAGAPGRALSLAWVMAPSGNGDVAQAHRDGSALAPRRSR
jgi:DNA-binding transcriptional ArsR family regulator